jgi:hypothetical protein
MDYAFFKNDANGQIAVFHKNNVPENVSLSEPTTDEIVKNLVWKHRKSLMYRFQHGEDVGFDKAEIMSAKFRFYRDDDKIAIRDATTANGAEQPTAEEVKDYILAKWDNVDPNYKEIMGDPKREEALAAASRNRSCSNPIVWWLGARWYGVPAPIRWWNRGLAAVFPNRQKPENYRGCGCLVKVKAAWMALKWLWKA